MSRYNEWQNKNLIEVIKGISDETWSQDLDAFFHSLKGTLNHILYADRAWMDRFKGKEVLVKDPKSILAESKDDWIRMRKQTDEEISFWFQNVQEDWLKNDFKFYSYILKTEISKPTWLLVSHLFNHQTHHRSQATSILHRLGINYGVTDLAWIPPKDSK